jgi:HrpA-like RNA helicase
MAEQRIKENEAQTLQFVMDVVEKAKVTLRLENESVHRKQHKPGSSDTKVMRAEIGFDHYHALEYDLFKMKEDLDRRRASREYVELLKLRQSLPVFAMRQTIVDVLSKNVVTIISGETGSGKR